MSNILRFARTLGRSPASAIAAVLTLTLAIGAGAAIFAVVDAVLLTPPPFADPAALVTLGEAPIDNLSGAPTRTVAYATFEAWRERGTPFATLEAFDGTNFTLTDLGTAERLSANDVTPGFLSLVGVSPILGRAFGADDVGQPVVIVSNDFWRGKLTSDPDVIGRQLVLGGRPHVIIGVLPENFSFALNRCDVWRPMVPASAERAGYRVQVIARLVRGSSPTSVAMALDEVSRESVPASRVIATEIATVVAGDAKTALPLVGWAAALAVVLAFINLAGLLVLRALDRRRDIAVRTALGARQSDIARSVLLEAVALALLGALGGIVLASWLAPVAAQLVSAVFGGVTNQPVRIEWRVIGAVILIVVAAATACGSVTAAGILRWSTVDILHRGMTSTPREARLRRAFVTAEVALAFVLLLSLASLGRTLLRMTSIDPGFNVRGVFALQVSLPTASYASDDRVTSFYSTIQDALTSRFGSGAVSIIDELPLTSDRGRRVVRATPGGVMQEAVVRSVSPGYFDVMRIPVTAGRSFDVMDNSGAPRRVLISESLAKLIFRGESAVGRQIWLGIRPATAEIVGVVGDVKHRALDESTLPTMYVSAWQEPSPSSVVVIRSQRSEAEVATAVRNEVAQVDGDLPVYRVRSMTDVVTTSPGVAIRRLLTATFSAFALLAVVLSAIGLFGVVAHDVANRRRELALRIALGAIPIRILWVVVHEGVMMLASGLALGGLLSMWATRGLNGLTIAVSGSVDVTSTCVAAAFLLAVGAVVLMPVALRALHTSPIVALRNE